MSKSIIYAGNSAPQILEQNMHITFPSIVRRYGSNLAVSGGEVIVRGAGYYEGDVNITYVPIESGTATFTVYKDGSAIPFATTTQQVAIGTVYSTTIPFVLKSLCCDESNISVKVNEVGVTVSNASIVVEKL